MNTAPDDCDAAGSVTGSVMVSLPLGLWLFTRIVYSPGGSDCAGRLCSVLIWLEVTPSTSQVPETSTTTTRSRWPTLALETTFTTWPPPPKRCRPKRRASQAHAKIRPSTISMPRPACSRPEAPTTGATSTAWEGTVGRLIGKPPRCALRYSPSERPCGS